MGQFVQVERVTRTIREIVLKRPQRRNALSLELLEDLIAALDALAADRETRAVILRGDGPVFSAGLDLKEAADESLAERSAAALGRALRLLRETPLVVIAAVHGGAYAGGAGLMAACDIVVAAEETQIGFPEARRGLLPALISRVLRPKVRDGDLRDLFLVGEPISAERARQLGLVQRLVPAASLLGEARRIAESVVAGGPETIRQTKHLLNALFDAPSAGADPSLETLHLAARRSAEAREGMAAFIEKREPAWIKENMP
jgi:methylglutaconyl-CoA hydratase